ncbi:hypothetical protein DACRYDRAFT_54475 [Dacryopinax primogenitus]|uniref:Phosphatidylinositol 4-kinase n=1 Tax=Dacryopinax primogenitus (strain DJM 731) TaxID=1858805 RepID=M5FX51_DACPD|nr:uncharacterized protein DACRYDRAFT_54475 [Dacryopinax primogenitus]EJU00310.1 hypothetical protein DACRYDRAFT_54475 [Dacryopinax primogenitus]
MPTEYRRLAQSIEDPEEGEAGPSVAQAATRSEPSIRSPISPGRLTVNLAALDSGFKRWTDSISQKIKRKRKSVTDGSEKKEIAFSVFGPVGVAEWKEDPRKTLDHEPVKTRQDFDQLVDALKAAIDDGVHPKMISKGSSGSYFARAKVDGQIKTVGVFKPKDEEPYGKMNPKLVKWLHRNFFWWIGWGRACLIPNLSYISEAAACLLDERLHLYIVPQTGLASLSSPSFFYDWIDRSAYRQGKALPPKIGSLQTFMHGYRDASEYFRQHPLGDNYDYEAHRTGMITKRFWSAMGLVCGRAGDLHELENEEWAEEQSKGYREMEEQGQNGFAWTQENVASFQDELERLVVLDYLMRNTDRGLDNFMIKYCEADHEKDIINIAPSRSFGPQLPMRVPNATPSSTPQMRQAAAFGADGSPNPSASSSSKLEPFTARPHMHIAAIDNSLSFPHQHPRGWRSYPYGWLFLPVAIIGRPFSERTRRQLLPLLSSAEWWAETRSELRKIMAVDPDFNEKLFNRQMAVIKGQGWNIVQSLQHVDEGPLELTRRTKVLIWDDDVQVPTNASKDELLMALAAPPGKTIPPLLGHSRHRSESFPNAQVGRRSMEFPPRSPRRQTDLPIRPVPFAGKYERASGGYSGVTGIDVLEHLEKLDAVERDLERLGMESASTSRQRSGPNTEGYVQLPEAVHSTPSLAETISPAASPSPRKGKSVPRPMRRASLGVTVLPPFEEEDPFLDPPSTANHRRAESDVRSALPSGGSRSMDFSSSEGRPSIKIVIREVRPSMLSTSHIVLMFITEIRNCESERSPAFLVNT